MTITQHKAHFVTLVGIFLNACSPSDDCANGLKSVPSTLGVGDNLCAEIETSSTSTTNNSTENDIPTGDVVTSTSGENTTEDISSSSSTTPQAVCGNGIVEGEEYCDDGVLNKAYIDAGVNDCTIDCKHPYCGDSILNKNEECDNGGTGLNGCDQCVQCGNGIVSANELCDDGDGLELDSCSACKPVFYAFVTSETFQGNMGSLEMADENCQDAIKNSDHSGLEDIKKMTFKAWISDSANSPETRFSEIIKNHTGDIRKIYGNVDDVFVTNNGFVDLVNGNLLAPINRDETGKQIPSDEFAWTGFDTPNNNGRFCGTEKADWMSNGSLNFGTIGSLQAVDSQWQGYVGDDLTKYSCNQKHHLYCFSQ